MIELIHFLVEVVLVPLIHWTPICSDRFEAHLGTLIKESLELLLKISKFMIQARVFETFRSLLVRLAVGNVDSFSFSLFLALFAFSCRDRLARFNRLAVGLVRLVGLDVVQTCIKTLRHGLRYLISRRSVQRGSTCIALSSLL